MNMKYRMAAYPLFALCILFLPPSAAGRISAAAWAADFGLADVASRAQELAQKPYQAPPEVSEELKAVGYEQWRGIHYRPEAALWRGQSPFTVEFFHSVFLYKSPLAINVIQAGQARA